MQMTPRPTIRTSAPRYRIMGTSRPSAYRRPCPGRSILRRSAAARRPTFRTTPTATLAGVSSMSVATGATAAMPAFSTSTRTTPRRARTRTSARDSFSTPNGGPGAAAPGAFPPAPAGGMSTSPKAEWGTGRSPVDPIFENNVFCYFLPFFRMRDRPEV